MNDFLLGNLKIKILVFGVGICVHVFNNAIFFLGGIGFGVNC